MCVYLKYRYMGWISDIPEITEPGTYQLNSLDSPTNNCYKIASPQDNQFFVLEYRKRSSLVDGVPGAGLLVYRIDADQDGQGNADGNPWLSIPDEVYLFRPGGGLYYNGYLSYANLTAYNGYTEISDFNRDFRAFTFLPTDDLFSGKPAVEGPAGFKISNVGSADSQISFQVSFSGEVFFSPGTGTYLTPRNIIISTMPHGFPIYYTTDGSDPNQYGIPYTGPVMVDRSMRLRAICVTDKGPSEIATADYLIIKPKPLPPTFSVASGTYSSTQLVAIKPVDFGAKIYYTTDGSDPTTDSTPYTIPVMVDRSMQIKAISCTRDGVSDMASASYRIIGRVSTPVIRPNGGVFATPQNVTITCDTPYSDIYYSTDESNPGPANPASVKYTVPFSAQSTQTIKAASVRADWITSDITASTLTFRSGTTIFVNKSVPASSAHDGKSWDTAFPDIASAVRASTSGDQIWVAAGTYPCNVNLGVGVSLYGGFAGIETMLGERTPASTTILDGGGVAPVIMVAQGTGAQSVIDGLTIQNGYAEKGGGGICCFMQASPTITNNVFTGNRTLFAGGAILCQYGSNPAIQHNTFSGNSASQSGAGIACYYKSAPIISDNTFNFNLSSSGGGAIACYYNDYNPDSPLTGQPDIHTNVINQNTAYQGGGIAVYASSPLIKDNNIHDNSSSNGFGGGIYFYNSFGATVTGNTIKANNAFSSGGGIACDYYTGKVVDPKDNPQGGSSKMLISANTISGNQAKYGDGGGITCRYYSSPVIANNVIANNWSKQNGGGINVRYYSRSRIINNTLVGNGASAFGGGIFVAQSPLSVIANNIVAYGSSGLVGDSQVVQIANNCVFSNKGTDYSGIAIGTMDLSNVDPMFVDWINGDYHLSPNSPCIDAGDSSYILSGWTDRDGKLRVVGSSVDIGAYESGNSQ